MPPEAKTHFGKWTQLAAGTISVQTNRLACRIAIHSGPVDVDPRQIEAESQPRHKRLQGLDSRRGGITRMLGVSDWVARCIVVVRLEYKQVNVKYGLDVKPRLPLLGLKGQP
ncbi:hypothetical protein MPDQ_004485 [Monascus purpureus]|uniref:Uncharacterized protein n=1 Tax=Monascus purpureus TaxID=5098 RepID=A0A507R007_MONPU|nr:hypothetical protein MPDQ_004485 [Monascus purpureus]